MRHSVSTRLALALLTVSVSAVSTSAAQADPLIATDTTAGFSLPKDAAAYSDLGSVYFRTPYLGADGHLAWLWGRQRTRDDAKAIGTVLGSTSGAGDAVIGTLGRSVAQRLFTATIPSGLGLPYGTTAFDGGSWFTDLPSIPRPARSRLLRFDDRYTVDRRITAPKGITYLRPVPTSRGLRVVATQRASVGKRRVDLPVVVDGKRVTHQRYLRSVAAAAPLPDGSLIMAGTTLSKTDLPMPVLRISPAGKVSRLADRRAEGASTATGLLGAVPTSAGLLMDEQSADQYGYSDGSDFKTAVVVRDGRGRVAERRYLRDLVFPRAAECGGPPAKLQLLSIGVGPDGLPMIRVACRADVVVTTTYGDSYLQNQQVQSIMLGLDADLNVRWLRDAPESGGRQSYPSCATDSITPEGKLLVVGCDGATRTVTVPGALPVSTGKVLSAKRDGAAGALVRIRCRQPYGAVCAGTVEVTRRGVVVGRSYFALPGRPGKAAATIIRHVSTESALPKTFSTKLVGTPAAG